VTESLIIDAAQPTDLPTVRALLREYVASLPFDLDFQGFDDEVAMLPGAYAPPRGALLVARADTGIVGCVGVRALDEDACEMKRLYVLSSQRGTGLGRRLAEASITEARRLGYRTMRLDTVPGMETAQAIYSRLGFRDAEPYTANPVPGTRFLQLDLT
jgi:putative acetyltransferase